MHTFLAIAGDPTAGPLLRSFCDRLRRVVPFDGTEAADVVELPGLRGNGRYIVPADHVRAPRGGCVNRSRAGSCAPRAGPSPTSRPSSSGGRSRPECPSPLSTKRASHGGFTAAGIERLVAEHARGAADHAEVLGTLVTLDSWRVLLGLARSLAR